MDLSSANEIILKQYQFNPEHANKLVAEIPLEQKSKSAGPGLENHPSFTLEHLVTASAITGEDLGMKYEVPIQIPGLIY